MAKLAVVTPYGLFNYGNRLQNWAVTTSLRSRGFDPETLILKAKYPGPVLRDLARHVVHSANLRHLHSKRYRRFLEFDKSIKTRRIYSAQSVPGVLSEYVGTVIGSDQIWNPYQVDFDGAEFGLGAAAGSVVSLSASFGIDSYPVERASAASSYLSRIERISVREESAQDIVRGLTGREVPVVIDPTLSLSADIWRRRADYEFVPGHDYGFVYMLGKYAPVVRTAVDELIVDHSARTVRLYDLAAPGYFPAGPQDFVGLIAESKLVVTDSYHAVIFGILFGKSVYLVERNDKPYSMASRFETLSSLLGVEFEEAREIGGVPCRRVLSSHVGDQLKQRRVEFEEFLDSALAGMRPRRSGDPR
ncbi:polysaccharide pyruvyl transferase family protein [Brevibacterium senegalense]|uniref:polysaccharide pyruvyl transferase family protein n=1 Tax=Brevibacterium senegalense TaxID=1033736 RepID=UPI000A000EAB|nr:polysaccharide pyruvyl transferase family protein [Brevibacterium senegalense]